MTKLWTVEIQSPSGHRSYYQVDTALVEACGISALADASFIQPLIDREFEK